MSTFSVSAAGIYILTESNRCGEATDTIVISYHSAPDSFSLGPDTILCPGEFILLSAPSTAYELEWQDGSQQPTIIADQAITYSLQLRNACGIATDDIMISYDSNVPQLYFDPNISWCEGDVITLDATQSFPSAYLWSTGETSSLIQVTTPGQYQVEVISRCSITSGQVEVIPIPDCILSKGIYIPNVFSPNGDGINDLFEVHTGTALQVVAMDGSIYDRWGNLVFSIQTSPYIWDGSFSGETVMPGVFVYTIKIKYLDQGIEREEVFAGDVTVVR